MSTTTNGLVSLTGLDPASYERHLLHGADRSYLETNCYTDILIELLHALGREPLAGLGAAVRMDFEGDQWSFFKPPPTDLEVLFGLDVHEMQPYRPAPEQAREQILQGRTLIVELDSFYLPDTAATAYGREHVKSSVVIEAIDPQGERMRYFHGTGLYELAGEDYRGVFRLGREFSADVLPPYTELARFDAGPALEGAELRRAAAELTRGHLRRRPASNPFVRFGAQLAVDLPRLLEGDAEDYHAYAFATVRMAGSTFEALGSHVRWLLGEQGEGVAGQLEQIVSACKVLSFRLARRKSFDPAETIEALALAWEQAMSGLEHALA
jgi:hypothetical protein